MNSIVPRRAAGLARFSTQVARIAALPLDVMGALDQQAACVQQRHRSADEVGSVVADRDLDFRHLHSSAYRMNGRRPLLKRREIP